MQALNQSDVRSYRVGPDFIDKGIVRANRKLAPIFAVMIVGVVFPVLLNNRDDLKILLVILTFVALLMTFSMIRSIRRTRACIRKIAATFELRIGNTEVTRVAADTPNVTVAFAEITEITQYPNRGLLLKTSRVLQTLEIPETLEDYSQVVDLIRQRVYVPIIVRDERPWNSPVFAMVVGLVLWVAFLNLKSKTSVLLLGTALLALSCWGIWALTKSPNVSKGLKRSRLVYIFLMIITVARMLSVAGILK
jgi:hypothetical protein